MASAMYKQVGAVMRSPAVRRQIAAVADGIASRAQAIANADTAEDAEDITIGRVDGTRPKGRPFARVTAPLDQEFGTPRTARRRILGQAIR